MKDKISITIDKQILKRIDSIVDNVVIRNRSQAIEYLVNNSLGKSRTAVILSGGDDRILKVDKEHYRITAVVNGKSVVERAIIKLRENSFKNIFIIARSNILTKIFEILKDGSNYGVKINYIEERNSDGSATSLRLVNGKISTTFLVVFGDIIFDKINIEELWNQHILTNAIATLMLTTSSTPSKKGIVKMEGNKILEFEQKPKESDIYLGFSSMFVAEPSIFNFHGKSLEKDIFPILAEKGLLQGHISAEREIHIHSLEDIKNYENKFVKKISN